MSQLSTSEDLPVTARGRATRQSILDAAEEVFGELGYDRASVAEITRRAGVAQGTFYVYFPDKKTAFTSLVRVLNHDMRAAIAAALDGEADRFQMERLGFKAFFDYVARHRALYKLVREAEFVDYDIYRWHYDTLGAGYVRGLKRAIADGQLRTDLDPVTVSNILMGIAEFTGGRWVLNEGTSPPDDVFEQIMSFIERGLTAR